MVQVASLLATHPRGLSESSAEGYYYTVFVAPDTGTFRGCECHHVELRSRPKQNTKQQSIY
jgi:hypothetical protein